MKNIKRVPFPCFFPRPIRLMIHHIMNGMPSYYKESRKAQQIFVFVFVSLNVASAQRTVKWYGMGFMDLSTFLVVSIPSALTHTY